MKNLRAYAVLAFIGTAMTVAGEGPSRGSSAMRQPRRAMPSSCSLPPT